MDELRSTALREEAMCDNCPFAPSGPGLALRKSLRPGRFNAIAQAVFQGIPFWCHKTTDWDAEENEDGDEYTLVGRERECGGSVAFRRRAQEARAEREALVERLRHQPSTVGRARTKATAKTPKAQRAKRSASGGGPG